MKNRIIALAASLLLVLTACAGGAGEGRVNSGMVKLQQENAFYKLPYITGGAKEQMIDKVNADILRIAKEAVAHLGKDAQECVVGYEVGCARDELFAMALFVYAYSGGAHGSTVIIPLNFDLRTGELMALEEQFKSGSGWQSALLGHVEDDIENSADYRGSLEVPKSIPKEQGWSFTQEVIVLIYQEYEIGPYALGSPVFDIPIREITSLISDNSPLQRLLD